MSYLTIKNEINFRYEEKKSIFIANIKRVQDEDQAKEYILKIKNENKEARHNCYAYIIGEKSLIQKFSDDGEPQKTAGYPIHQVIMNNNIHDVVIVVTRYFGGILLGASGLTRAYSKSASSVMKNAEIIERVEGVEINIEIDYGLIGKIQYYLCTNNIKTNSVDYLEKVNMNIFIEKDNISRFSKDIEECTSGTVKIKYGAEEYFYKEGTNLSR